MKARTIVCFLAPALVAVFVSTALASSGHGEEATWTPTMIGWRIINFLVLFGFLIYFLKKPLVSYFSERKEQIRRDLEEAREQRDQAEQKLKEYEKKLAGMEQELQKMRQDLQKAADLESEKVVANAERMSAGIVESAKLAAEQELRKAKMSLRNEAVDLAVELAESLISEKITEEDRKKIVEDYLDKVGGVK
jgi:F-type H+-transporting ATPase subunit b